MRKCENECENICCKHRFHVRIFSVKTKKLDEMLYLCIVIFHYCYIITSHIQSEQTKVRVPLYKGMELVHRFMIKSIKISGTFNFYISTKITFNIWISNVIHKPDHYVQLIFKYPFHQPGISCIILCDWMHSKLTFSLCTRGIKYGTPPTSASLGLPPKPVTI